MNILRYIYIYIYTYLFARFAGSGMGAAAVLERGDCVDELSNARAAISGESFLSKDAK